MNQPTRPTPYTPKRPRTNPTGVPLSVWLTEPLAGCCPVCETPVGAACANRIPLGLARQIVEAFTAPGDLVYVPDAGNASCLIAAVTTGRKALGYARTRHDADLAYANLQHQAAQVASLALLRRGHAGSHSTTPDHHHGSAQLAIAAPHAFTTHAELAALTDACAQALKPDGVLVMTARQSTGQDTTAYLIAHARASGLVYLQHIVAAEATATDGHLNPATPAPLRPARTAPATTPGRGPAATT
ncbi:hypothetical protein E6W39_14110 [Kitasatospora acidiphila]|uniref:Methyltransferase n=1 Tax=Kitasatospora acidiphila TaxID=2567942 RepID=A0A540W2B5_9ACTN|nr:hypothetical protein [Kitasatospora acidiphila]TQF03170.1 hypothetical protein E6W39_14110 [Kitasatospora acidiphila]